MQYPADTVFTASTPYRGIRWYVTMLQRNGYSVLINRLVEPPIMRLSYTDGSHETTVLPTHDKEMG